MKDNKDCKAIFCENVRWLRKFRGFSGEQMAEIMGISLPALERIEKDGEIKRNLGTNVIFNMDSVFKIKAHILLQYSLGDIYNRLTPDVISALIELIAFCAPKNKAEK